MEVSRHSPPLAAHADDARPPAAECKLECINMRTAIVAIAALAVCIWLAPTAAAALVYSVLAIAVIAVVLLAINCQNESDASSTTVHHSHVYHATSAPVYVSSNVPHIYPIATAAPPAAVVRATPYGSADAPFTQPRASTYNAPVSAHRVPAYRAPVGGSQSSGSYGGALPGIPFGSISSGPQRAVVGGAKSSLPGQP